MNFQEIQKEISLILSQGRFKHTTGVAQTARELAIKFGADPNKAELTGWFHDIAKGHKAQQLLIEAQNYNIYVSPIGKLSPHLLHARIGACIARDKFGIKDQEILNAITQHTLGKANMSLLEQILFLADAIEPNRSLEWIQPIRNELNRAGLNAAIVKSCQVTIAEVIEKSFLLHPITIETYNFYLSRLNS